MNFCKHQYFTIWRISQKEEHPQTLQNNEKIKKNANSKNLQLNYISKNRNEDIQQKSEIEAIEHWQHDNGTNRSTFSYSRNVILCKKQQKGAIVKNMIRGLLKKQEWEI